METALDFTTFFRHLIDISIVAYLAYRGLLLVRGTRAASMLGGLALIALLYFVSRPIGLPTVSWILGNFLSSIILIIVVIFQDDIRRGLTKVGLQPVFVRLHRRFFDSTLEDISAVCAQLSKQKLGALIVVQREVGLDEFVEEAVYLDARISRKLLLSLFVKHSPLHDGAVIIESNKIKAAGCVLPLSSNPDLDPNLGTRHRAAVGITERSDAIVLVVSEEDGCISIVRDGRLTRNLDPSMVHDALHRLVATEIAADPRADINPGAQL